MENIVLLIIGIIATMITYILNVKLKLCTIRSSALPTLIVAGLIYIFPQLLSYYLNTHTPVVFIGGTFIGMVSSQQLSTYSGLSIASLIFTTIYLNTSAFFTGYGGALGTSACISLLVVLSIPYLKSKRKMTIGLLQLRNFVFKNKKNS